MSLQSIRRREKPFGYFILVATEFESRFVLVAASAFGNEERQVDGCLGAKVRELLLSA